MRFRAALGLIGLVFLGCGNVASDGGGQPGNPNPGPGAYPEDPTQSTPPGSVPPPPGECPGVGVATGEWSFEFDGTDESYADAVAVTSSGSVFVSGTASSSIGPGDTATGWDTRCFVARFAPDGELLWVKRYLGGSVTLLGDGEEGVFVAGAQDGTLEAYHSTLLEHLDCHGNSLAKLDAPDAEIFDPSLALRNDGKLILAGKFVGDLGIGGTPQSPKDVAVFIAELGADGSHGWVHTFDEVFEGKPKVVTASNGESILAISAEGYPVLGQPDAPPAPPPTGTPFPPGYQAKTHVARYDIAGNGVGIKRLDGEGFDSVRVSSIDASDRVFIGLDTNYPAGNAAVLASVEPASQLYSTMELGIAADPIVLTSSFFEGDQLFLSAIAPKGSDFGSGPTAEWSSVVLTFDATNSKLVSATPIGPAIGKVYGFVHSPAGKSVIVGAIPSGPGVNLDVTGFVSVK